MKRKTRIVMILGGTALVAAAFYGGVWFTDWEHGGLAGESAVRAATDSPQAGSSTLDMQLFYDSVNFVKDNYFKPADITDSKLLYGAISGAVNSLGDPYTEFFAPDDAQTFQEDVQGNFGGIGAEIGLRAKDKQLVIIAPLKDNPAALAGLKAGDEILKIDDTETAGISLDDAVKLIRGAVGTDVQLLIDRTGWDAPKEFTVRRGNIIEPTLDYQMLPGNIAYFHLYSFNANAPADFYNDSVKALLQGARGVIMDVRGDPGGYLDVATNVAGWFLNRGDLIVTEDFPGGKTQPYYANGTGAWRSVPVVVLVDGGSASASEILTGALRDVRGATVVGTTSFGKGTVQEVQTLPDGSKIKVSVAEWVTPDGHRINGKGIAPDVVVEATSTSPTGGTATSTDPQLARALQIVQEQSKNIKVIQTVLLP